MLVSILAIVFVLRISKNSDRYAPKLLAIHYGVKVRNIFRELETAQKKTVKREADIEFLRKCLLSRLTFKFVRFKLYREAAYKLEVDEQKFSETN